MAEVAHGHGSPNGKHRSIRHSGYERAVQAHSQDLDAAAVVERLADDLRERGRIDERPSDDDLVEVIIDEYIRFPAPQAA